MSGVPTKAIGDTVYINEDYIANNSRSGCIEISELSKWRTGEDGGLACVRESTSFGGSLSERREFSGLVTEISITMG